MNVKTSAHKRTVINGLLTVKESLKLSANLIRIVFTCDKTLNVDPQWIGPHLKLLFPLSGSKEIHFPQMNEESKIIWQEGVRERVRTYSVRNYNSVDNTMAIDFVVHQHGIATTWAQQAKAGDTIGLVAMGSKNRFDENIQLILLGDISALPAISYTLEHLPAYQKAIAIIEVRDEQDKITINVAKHAMLKCAVTPQGEQSKLIDMVNQLNLAQDDDSLVFWGGMESSVSQALRHHLKANFSQVPADSIRLISYWREGFAEGQFKHHD